VCLIDACGPINPFNLGNTTLAYACTFVIIITSSRVCVAHISDVMPAHMPHGKFIPITMKSFWLKCPERSFIASQLLKSRCRSSAQLQTWKAQEKYRKRSASWERHRSTVDVTRTCWTFAGIYNWCANNELRYLLTPSIHAEEYTENLDFDETEDRA